MFNFLVSVCFAQLWDYERNGPDKWPVDFQGCRGERQSPIDIQPGHARYNPRLRYLRLNNYDRNYLFNVTNNDLTSNAFFPMPNFDMRFLYN